MGKGGRLHGSMLAKQCLTQEVRFQRGPQVLSLPRDGGTYFPTSCRWPGLGSLKLNRRSCWYRVPIRHLSSEDGTTHFCTLVTLSHRMKNLAREVTWGLVLLHHRCGCPSVPPPSHS